MIVCLLFFSLMIMVFLVREGFKTQPAVDPAVDRPEPPVPIVQKLSAQ